MSLSDCLIGLHIGDSLGATLEFCSPSKDPYTQTEIIGGGKHNWIAGAPTDDTEMAIMVANSLIECKVFDIYDLSGRFMEWITGEPADVGRTTYLAIDNLRDGVSPFKSGLNGPNDQGNGSLMRCAPLAYFNVSKKNIFDQCAITHNHILCQLSDYILISAIKNAESGMNKVNIYNFALNQAKENVTLYEYLLKIKNLKWSELKTSGFVVHTLGAAFWGLLNTETFEDALIQVVNRGDDADTSGAVCGALCGAYYGSENVLEIWKCKLVVIDKITNIGRHYDKSGSK